MDSSVREEILISYIQYQKWLPAALPTQCQKSQINLMLNYTNLSR